jgi:hypothetical protein
MSITEQLPYASATVTFHPYILWETQTGYDTSQEVWDAARAYLGIKSTARHPVKHEYPGQKYVEDGVCHVWNETPAGAIKAQCHIVFMEDVREAAWERRVADLNSTIDALKARVKELESR